MKKLILSLVMMMSLMSFVEKNENIEEEIVFSPECFDYASNMMILGNHEFYDPEIEHIAWEGFYYDCERNSNFDEFQFPN